MHIIEEDMLHGLTDQDSAIIHERLPIVRTFLLRWLPADHPGRAAIETRQSQLPPELHTWFADFEQSVTHADALQQDPPDRVAHADGLRTWYNQYLIPLAQELAFVQQAQQIVCHTCWRQGLFDRHDTTKNGKLARPPFEAVWADVQQILSDTAHKTSKQTEQSRSNQLVERTVCRNQDCATQVAEALRTDAIHARAAGMTRGLVRSYLQHEHIGLLLHSPCPYLNALLLLEHQQQVLHASDEQQVAPDILATVRADIIAFYYAAQSVHPKLWNERLLHEPANTPTRQHYQHKHLWHNQRTRFIAAIQQQRGCTEEEATRLLDILSQQGLPNLIDWRRGASGNQTRATLEEQRYQRMLAHHLSALHPDDRQTIETMFHHLLAAMQQSEVALPIAMLLNDYPSSHRRRRLGRRFWFGLSNILHRRESRRQRRQRQWQNSIGKQQKKRDTQRQQTHDDTANRLVAAFAERAGLDARDARTLLRDLITYGPLGLLPRTARMHALYQPLESWLALIKLGRLTGSVPWLQVVEQVNTYREQLGLPHNLSPQLTRVVFNNIAKPSYWHGGQGEAVARVRQRATVNADKIPRLHATWVLAPVQMPITGRDNQIQMWHGLLVFDRGSQLLMGACFSKNPPGMREVQLALYEAIWHPAEPGWYLHGIPETIQIPEELATEGLYDLQQAATFLLSDIDTRYKKPWLGLKAVKQVLDTVRKQGGEEIRQVLGIHNELHVGQIMQVILRWVKTLYFPAHSGAPVPRSIRVHGVAMPGFDTPAAGWLLPVTDSVKTMTNGVVVYKGTRYTSPWFHSDVGKHYPCRIYPFYVPCPDMQDEDRNEQGLFIEIEHQGERQLRYLTRKQE